MKVCIYTIYDTLSEESGPLFIARNDRSALRMYETMLKKDDIDDATFKLLHIGEYDTELCKLEPIAMNYSIDKDNVAMYDKEIKL